MNTTKTRVTGTSKTTMKTWIVETIVRLRSANKRTRLTDLTREIRATYGHLMTETDFNITARDARESWEMTLTNAGTALRKEGILHKVVNDGDDWQLADRVYVKDLGTTIIRANSCSECNMPHGAGQTDCW